MDFGSDEILKANELYPIKEEFLNFPFQCCLLSLADLNLKSKTDYKKLDSYFSDLNKKSSSIRAFVTDTNSDNNDNVLTNVYLFAEIAKTNEIVFVNKNLKKSGW